LIRGVVKTILGSTFLTREGSRRIGPAVVVLCYHDICSDDDFTSWMRVPLSMFKRHLKMLKRVGRFISPYDLFDPIRLATDRLNLMVTFDDGYINLLRMALPLLSQHQIPALVFISTRPMIEQKPFWPDVFITPIQTLRIRELDLKDFGFGVYSFRENDDVGRWEDVQHLLEDVKAVGNTEHPKVSALLTYMNEQFRGSLAAHLSRFRPMATDEVRKLSATPWVTVGAHGHDHSILTYLTNETLDMNMLEPRRILEEVTGKPPTDLAYPNGDVDDRVVRCAAEAGYVRGWTTQEGLLLGEMDMYRLPRIMIGAFDTPSTIGWKINRLIWSARG